MKRGLLETIGMTVNGLSIALFFYFANILDIPDVPLPLTYIAWLLFGLGLLSIILSVVTLLSNRESGLVDRGIYGLTRHPMYLGAILLFSSWIFFHPHWIIMLISLTNTIIVYIFMVEGERQNLSKFGDSYRRYMDRVPRCNVLLRLFRILRGK